MKNLYSFLLFILFSFGISANAQLINTVAGVGVSGYSGDGSPATAAAMHGPTSLTSDGDGNLYFADQQNHCIRKVTPSGIISTVAGTGTFGFTGDGGPASTAKLALPWGVAADNAGNIFIADQMNYRVRKVTTTGQISTIAGTGTRARTGDGGPAAAAAIGEIVGITLDAAGNIYLAEQDFYDIRKISTTGIITTIAGCGLQGNTGDGGPASAATFGYLFGIAVDGYGNVYAADGYNNNVRKINTAGTISTIAGTGVAGYNGDGGPATAALLDHPLYVSIDARCNIIITDCYNSRIRMIDTAGIINTIAGTGIAGFSGDGGLPLAAKLDTPLAAIADMAGNVYINDYGNDRIRRITYASTSVKDKKFVGALDIYPNPNTGDFTVTLPTVAGEEVRVNITNILGEKINDYVTSNSKLNIHLDAPPGNYFVTWVQGNETGTGKVTVK